MIKELDVQNVNDVIRLGLKLNPNFNKLYNYDSLNKEVNKTYIITTDDKLIGFIHIQDLVDEIDIIDIVIDDIYRRKGYGYKLIADILDKYKDKTFILEVSSDNIAAINLYKKLGFEEINIRKGYYNGVDAIVMEKKW